MQPHFNVTSFLDKTWRRDHVLTDQLLVKGGTGLHQSLVDGEWLEHYSTTDERVLRNAGYIAAGPIGDDIAEGAGPSWPVLSEAGRFDVQMSSEPKVPLLYQGDFEAKTDVCNTTGLVTVGQALSVQNILMADGTVRRGLALVDTAATAWVVGFLIRVWTDGWIKFHRVYQTP